MISSVGVASAWPQSSTPSMAGGQSFPGAQQIVQVCLQVGEERDVGAEVVAACAPEWDPAGPAAGLDVGWFGAGAVGDGDLADGVAGQFGDSSSRCARAPDPVTVPVEAERGDLVDRGAVLADGLRRRGSSRGSRNSFGDRATRHRTSIGTPASACRWA